MAEVILRSLPKPISYDDEILVTKHKARHVLWLFPETPRTSPPISNLVSCTYVSSMNIPHGREGGGPWEADGPALWIWGLSAVKWECTKWSLKSLPASICPDFTYQQGGCITGLRTFRSVPQTLRNIWGKFFLLFLLRSYRNAFLSQFNSAF